MRICIDTNAYSSIGRANADVISLVEMADEVIVPATVVGELMFGFLRGDRLSQNEAALARFLHEEGVRFHPVTLEIAERYGYDIWIAATALETGARLLSYDSHFDRVGGLVRIAP